MRKYLLLSLILIFTTLSGVAQVKSEDSPKRIFTAEELQKVEDTIKRAETYFREGETLIRNKDITSARKKFDLAVETILLSGLNVQEFEGLQKYYNSLVEQIFKLEIPISLLPSTEQEKTKTTVPQVGFTEQKFEPSPLDELAKLELNETPKTDKLIVPNGVTTTNYSRPSLTIVTAKEGDTITTIAARYGYDAVEMARYNGLLPSSKIPAGREIRLPPKNNSGVTSKTDENAILGSKPAQSANGKVQVVMDWFQENLHDPYSMKIVRWSKIQKEYLGSEPYWVVRVRIRAKNTFGAYVLNDYAFFIRRNKIVRFSS